MKRQPGSIKINCLKGLEMTLFKHKLPPRLFSSKVPRNGLDTKEAFELYVSHSVPKILKFAFRKIDQ